MNKQQIVNEIHKAARKNFVRRSVILKGIDDLWQADLIDMQAFAKINSGFKYILVIIDTFSKFVWTIPIKTKTKSEVTSSIKHVIVTSRRVPTNLQTDLGKEFYNDEFRKLTTLNKINHYSTFSTKKASIVERVIRTLKNKLYKYFSFIGNHKWVGVPLNTVTNSYNNSKHRITKYRPTEVNHSNEHIVLSNIIKSQQKRCARKNKFYLGDSVRISKY